MYCTANGAPVLDGTINVPVSGVWTADLSVDDNDASDLDGPVTIVLDDANNTTLQGASRRALAFNGRVGVRVFGGAGGLNTICSGKHYRSTSAIIPARDIVGECGESLDPNSQLAAQFAHWSKLGMHTGGEQITQLANELGLSWRITIAGLLLIAAPSWNDSGLGSTDVLDRDPGMGTMTVASFVDAGQLVQSSKVTRCEHRFGKSEPRSTLFVDDVFS